MLALFGDAFLGVCPWLLVEVGETALLPDLELPSCGLGHAKHSAVQTILILESPVAPQDGAAVEKALLSGLEAPLGTLEAVTVMLLSGPGDKFPKAVAQ